MACLASLRLEARWGSWVGTPFSAESRSHITVDRHA
jgi:hypothetical protein